MENPDNNNTPETSIFDHTNRFAYGAKAILVLLYSCNIWAIVDIAGKGTGVFKYAFDIPNPNRFTAFSLLSVVLTIGLLINVIATFVCTSGAITHSQSSETLRAGVLLYKFRYRINETRDQEKRNGMVARFNQYDREFTTHVLDKAKKTIDKLFNSEKEILTYESTSNTQEITYRLPSSESTHAIRQELSVTSSDPSIVTGLNIFLQGSPEGAQWYDDRLETKDDVNPVKCELANFLSLFSMLLLKLANELKAQGNPSMQEDIATMIASAETLKDLCMSVDPRRCYHENPMLPASDTINCNIGSRLT